MSHSSLRHALALLVLGACAAPSSDEAELAEWAASAYHDAAAAGRPREAIERLEELLPATLGLPSAELRVEYYLTQAHLDASLDQPFLTEPTEPLVLGVHEVRAERPSATAHLVALVYHAAAARALLDEHEGGDDRARVEGNLRIATATTLARLGFHEAALRSARGEARLLELDAFQDVAARYDLPPELNPWLAVIGFEAHRDGDEATAYQFALRAIQGDVRYGHALPAQEVGRLERWVLEGASVRFVCPESGTPYVPGLRRSPRSGIPYEEYVTVPRER